MAGACCGAHVTRTQDGPVGEHVPGPAGEEAGAQQGRGTHSEPRSCPAAKPEFRRRWAWLRTPCSRRLPEVISLGHSLGPSTSSTLGPGGAQSVPPAWMPVRHTALWLTLLPLSSDTAQR